MGTEKSKAETELAQGDNSMAKKPGVGVVIGRFQVPSLTTGHKDLIKWADQHKELCIVIGVAPIASRTNPLPFSLRSAMLHQEFPHAVVLPAYDNSSDHKWSIELDKQLHANFLGEALTLYGGRDSFISHYSGRNKTVFIPEWNWETESGTSIRKALGLTMSSDFRSGVIYAKNQLSFGNVFPVVDIIGRASETKVLLGRKSSTSRWRFPGGFVDRADIDYLTAAKREFREETSCDLICPKPLIPGGLRINDWRYRDTGYSVMSMPYMGFYNGIPEASDDLCEVNIFDISEIHDIIVPEHKELASAAKSAILNPTGGWDDHAI